MNARRRTYIVGLVGAAVLASGAYAIGSAQGGGNASAARAVAARGPGHPPGPPLPGLADKLGVSQKQLRAALRDIRPSAAPHGGPSELAGALGVSEKELLAALGKLHGGDRDGDLSELADALGVPEADLKAAFEKTRPRLGRPPTDPAKSLADALGKSEDEVRAAFEKVHEQHEADFTAKLADALGLDPDDVRAALDKLHAQHEDQEQNMRDAFAKALADRLNIPESKVKDALDSLPHPGPPPGPPGAFGFGPPGPPPGPPGPPHGP
jgi:transcriptional regulator with XRE-family HTH domain